MPFWETVKLALDSMRGNAFRAALTMLGVIIGVAAVIAMLALGRGAQAAVDEQLATLGTDVLTVTTGMRWMGGVARDQQTLTLDDADALARGARHVAAVVPEQSGRQQVRLGARNLNLQVVGTLPEHGRVNGYELEYGRMFTAADDAATFFRRATETPGVAPSAVTTDCAAAYPPALATVLPDIEHATGKAIQQRIERDHQHLKGRLATTRGFKSLAGARVLCRAHAFLRNPRGGFYDLPWRLGAATAPLTPPMQRAWDALTTELLAR